ncbi:TraR/DksA family transcriptional regulator [Streptomyces fradiae]|uniref:TraR/DksA family transcriptional regulator n=1 Tax=Streptomyces fradiae TaxID=1906 RepID=UPI0036CEF07F
MSNRTARADAGLTAQDLAALRRSLQEQRRFRLEQLARMTGRAPAPEPPAAPEPPDPDPTAAAPETAVHGASAPAADPGPGAAPPALPREVPAPGPGRLRAAHPAPETAGPGEEAPWDGAAARREVRAELTASARMVLHDVEAALERMDRGGYGTCELCRHPVEHRRLAIVPQARYCGRCHRVREARR